MRIRERFNPHAPFEARRRSLLQRSSCWANFNPRAPCGARPKPYGAQPQRQRFQPTRPLRGATSRLRPLNQRKTISTHAPLAGRDQGLREEPLRKRISTHAPLAGRDGATRRNPAGRLHFNPRAPCGARPVPRRFYDRKGTFQPTRPLRGATIACPSASWTPTDFNPRAPCGARLLQDGVHFHPAYFNPRAPCGARPEWAAHSRIGLKFQPTRPLRGATA